MGVVNPIDGSYYFPQTTLYPVRASLQVAKDFTGQARNSATLREQYLRRAPQTVLIRGDWARPVRASLGLGLILGTPGRQSFELGTSEDIGTGRAYGSFTAQGRLYAVLQQLALGADITQRAAVGRMGLDVLTSGNARRPAYCGLSVKGQPTHPSHVALTVRGQPTVAAHGSASVKLDSKYAALGSVTTARVLEALARQTAELQTGEGLTILADLISTALEDVLTIGPGGFYLAEDITARLLVNNVEVPIAGFDYEEPEGRLGALLNVTLARPDRNQVPVNADIRFDLIVYAPDGTYSLYPLVADGKIAGRSINIQWADDGPGDEMTMGGLDTLNDKFALAPRRPITMFDPGQVKFEEVAVKPRDAIMDDKGQPIVPVLEPVAGLNMMQALERAYTGRGGGAFATSLSVAQLAELTKVAQYIGAQEQVGLGFSRVVTNIPTYPIARVDFLVESGWHDAVQPLIGMYGPIYFVEYNVLFIIDAEKALPLGHVARTLPLSRVTRLGLAQENRDPYNAVILTFQARGAEGQALYPRDKYEQKTDEDGEFGSLGYRRTETTRRYREWADDPAFTNIIEAQDLSVEVRTFGNFPTSDGGPGALLELHRETQQDFYTLGLKTGHHKTVQGLVTTGPDADLLLREVLEETCSIAYTEDSFNPGQKLQDRVHTHTKGLIYEETEDTYERVGPDGNEDVPKRYAVGLAQKYGIMGSEGRLFWGDVKTTTEVLRATSPTQRDVQVTEIDCLTGTVLRSTAQPRAASSAALAVNEFVTRQRSVLLRDLASEADIGPRIPVSVSAGDLPYDRAFELGLRVLARGLDPPETAQLDLPGVDFALRRGSVVKGQFRDNTLTPPFIVQGFRISGRTLGREGHRISMSLTGTELR